MQRGSAPEHAKGGNHAYEPKTVVAVQVGDEHRLYLREANARAPQLHLRALAAIYHEELATKLNHLRRCRVLQRGQCAATAKNMNIKRFHLQLILLLRETRKTFEAFP